MTSIIIGRDQGQCAVDANQGHRSDFTGNPGVPVHPQSALEDAIRAVDNPVPLKSIPFANRRIDDINLDGGIVLDVPHRLR
ncbi:MAG TPA: hypothetical protein VIX14_08655 [Terriglobales bacterium]